MQTRGPRCAAIAFVGAEAADMLPLQSGDVLVVNASPNALVNGATNPTALRAFVKRGVMVRSSARLHAKVMCTRTRGVIGSANASTNSQSSEEAAIITTDPSTVQQIRQFVLQMAADADDAVEEPFLEEADKLYARRAPRTSLPGVTGETSFSGLLRLPVQSVWITRAWPASAPEDFLRQAEAWRSRSDFLDLEDPRYFLRCIQVDDVEKWGFSPGDVLIFTKKSGDGYTFYAPVVVMMEEIRAKGHDGWFVWVREDSKLKSRAWSTARAYLTDRGVHVDPEETHITNPLKISAILGLWKLGLP